MKSLPAKAFLALFISGVAACAHAPPPGDAAPGRPSTPPARNTDSGAGSASTRERDLYVGRLLVLILRDWRRPDGLTSEDATALTASLELDIDADGRFVAFRLSQSSGSALFDASVAERMTALIDAGTQLPPGPASVVNELRGKPFTLRFRGP